ncbi:IMP dehydrogenase [Marinomonas sp. KJ51-3]|uniref:Inosine-5'-monophosphate dehydrogenase n=1 Tax=Marinomonas rhodophyticola TaxID=2992803 RepID=A0ABT3KEH6_9GAMM|nr:IMP dehydrogenase [Marinomonas sp. KJ51-3]
MMLRIVQEALTFDDVLLIPGYSEVLPKDVSLKTKITKDIELNIPLISSAMDTVTEHRMAIALAQEGGIGIVHKNLTIEEQAREVRRVKKFESGIVRDLVTINPEASVKELMELTAANSISSVPVVQGSDLVGIVTSRDVRFVKDYDKKVADIMTPKDRLVTALEGASSGSIRKLLHENRIEKVLIVNEQFELRGMVTVTDFNKATTFPNACKDDQGRLRVGAAVGTGADTADRVKALSDAGVDIIVVDTAHGHSKGVIDRVRWVKENFPHIQVIGGNIATAEAAIALADAGADGVKVGIGPGSICTTRIVTGVGVPQISAVANVAEVMNPRGIPVIADGGVRFSGDISKAIAAGASVIMVGGILAGTDEAPGEVVLFQGRSFKAYRGMGLAWCDVSISGFKRSLFPRFKQR